MFKSPFLNTKHNSEAIVRKSSAKNRNKKKKKKIAKLTRKQFCRSFFLNKVATLFKRDSGTCKTAKFKKKFLRTSMNRLRKIP